MRGQTFFYYALVAFAATAWTSPMVDEKVGIVDVGKDFVERREYIVARAG
jgi:hypothetical protein